MYRSSEVACPGHRRRWSGAAVACHVEAAAAALLAARAGAGEGGPIGHTRAVAVASGRKSSLEMGVLVHYFTRVQSRRQKSTALEWTARYVFFSDSGTFPAAASARSRMNLSTSSALVGSAAASSAGAEAPPSPAM